MRSSVCIDYIIACAGCHAPELIAATKFKTTKINFGGLFGLSTKITRYTVLQIDKWKLVRVKDKRLMGYKNNVSDHNKLLVAQNL